LPGAFLFVNELSAQTLDGPRVGKRSIGFGDASD
jgi:hypothetical protein